MTILEKPKVKKKSKTNHRKKILQMYKKLGLDPKNLAKVDGLDSKTHDSFLFEEKSQGSKTL